MALRITPSHLSLANIDEDEVITMKLENGSDKKIKFKFRLPPSNAISVTKSIGTIQPDEEANIEVMYREELNGARDSIISMQVKYVQLEDGDKDSNDVFTDKKDKVLTNYVTVTFEDDGDDMFNSPQVSSKSVIADKKPSSSKWWKKS